MLQSAKIRTDLLIAWERWDTHCTRVHADPFNHNKEPLGCPTTIAMEESCQEYAAGINIRCSALRDQLSTARRSGLSREEALDATVRTSSTLPFAQE